MSDGKPEQREARYVWRPIATAPKDGTQILVWVDGRVRTSSWIDGPDPEPGEEPQWWMPVPDAPTSEAMQGRGAALLVRSPMSAEDADGLRKAMADVPPGKFERMQVADPELYRIRITVCEMCLDGKGSECHVPECIFCRADVPCQADGAVPLRERIRDTGEIPELVGDSASEMFAEQRIEQLLELVHTEHVRECQARKLSHPLLPGRCDECATTVRVAQLWSAGQYRRGQARGIEMCLEDADDFDLDVAKSMLKAGQRDFERDLKKEGKERTDGDCEYKEATEEGGQEEGADQHGT